MPIIGLQPHAADDVGEGRCALSDEVVGARHDGKIDLGTGRLSQVL